MNSTTQAPATPLDVLVIGGGQAGLAMGYHLQRRGARFLIVDAAPQIGWTWQSRWDSLRLFTPAEFDALPGTPFPAPRGSYPGKDDVADYLAHYAQQHALPLRLGTEVTRLERGAGGDFVARTEAGEIRARQVVVATGPFQRPFIPELSGNLAPDLPQLHSAQYRNPRQFTPASRVLVAGAANSGLQIAAELAKSHRVTLAVGSRPPQLPQRILGRDLFHWLTRSGLMSVPARSRIARRIQARGDVVIGSSMTALRRSGVDIRPRLAGASWRMVHFADGSVAEIDSVVWATGYRPDYSWLHVDEVIRDGRVQHDGGVTHVPGLYFLGLPWQNDRGSALLGFVGRDAEALSRRIDAGATTSLAMSPGEPAILPAPSPIPARDL